MKLFLVFYEDQLPEEFDSFTEITVNPTKDFYDKACVFSTYNRRWYRINGVSIPTKDVPRDFLLRAILLTKFNQGDNHEL